MIPTTEAEAIAELRKVEKSLSSLAGGLKQTAADTRYSTKDRDTAKALAEFCDLNEAVVADVVAGLSQIFAQKNPSSVASLIAELTKK